MRPDLASEFREVLRALASEYGANREDVLAVARELPPAAPARRGPRRIDDRAALDEAARLRLSGEAAHNWAAATAVARHRPGHSEDAIARRLYRAMRSGRWPAMDFYRRFPNAAGIEVVPDRPFVRARRVLDRIR